MSGGKPGGRSGAVDGTTRAARLLVVAAVWLVLAAVAAGAWRWGVTPVLNRRANADAAKVQIDAARAEYAAASKSAEAAGLRPPAAPADGSGDGSAESIRSAAARLKAAAEGGAALTDAQWATLTPVADSSIPPITFARGATAVRPPADGWLTAAAADIKPMPFRYVKAVAAVAPNAGEAERALAKSRADAAAEFLVKAGLPANRVRGVVDESDGAQSQRVTFVIGTEAVPK